MTESGVVSSVGARESAAAGRGTLRVSDAEREAVARRLLEAHGEGRLTLAEYDHRVRRAHAAVVRADLDGLLGDLPTAPSGRPAARSARDGHRASSGPLAATRTRRGPGPCGAVPGALLPRSVGMRGAVAAWATASVVNLVIWCAVVLGTGAAVHPWWIWVAGPWGVVLAMHALAARALDRRPSHPGA